MTTDTTAVIEAGAPAGPEPSEWPLAEECLASNPAWLAYFTSRDEIPALEAAPDVVVVSGIRAQFDRDLDAYSEAYDGPLRAQVDGWHADARMAVFGTSRPVPQETAALEPVPAADEDDWAFRDEAQHDAEVALERWTRGVHLADPDLPAEPAAEVIEGVVAEPEAHHDDTRVLPEVSG